ncbi:peritrophin-48-like isoform X1 [Panulirus ornatus]|uniref:peritrophin-48-like isoform X1 n=1 Tax=Panulirus ornatus TaxID=150431 RepID=UPI003A844113
MATVSLAIVLLLVLVVPATHSRLHRANCMPNCSGHRDGYMVPDQVNCHRFYYCLNHEASPNPFSCSEGLVFNETLQNCVPGSSCVNICTEPCNYECLGPDPPEKISDRFQCGIYYDCLPGGQQGAPRFCPVDKPFFDGFSCQDQESECCSCLPYCSRNDILSNVIDPTNCRRYYFCVNLGIPEYPATCSAGNFDLITGVCSTTSPCLTLCTNVVRPDGCIEWFTCERRDLFAKCPQRCDARFYRCQVNDINHVIEEESCINGLYFHPDTKQCVERSECPYPNSSEY